jgi:hypothetical protein
MKRNLPIIIGISTMVAFAHEMPICEEFIGEEHIQCVATDKAAVIISTFNDSVQYEFYTDDGHKGYIYFDGGVVANTSKRHLKVATIPTENADEYVQEVFNVVMDDIQWGKN